MSPLTYPAHQPNDLPFLTGGHVVFATYTLDASTVDIVTESIDDPNHWRKILAAGWVVEFNPATSYVQPRTSYSLLDVIGVLENEEDLGPFYDAPSQPVTVIYEGTLITSGVIDEGEFGAKATTVEMLLGRINFVDTEDRIEGSLDGDSIFSRS